MLRFVLFTASMVAMPTIEITAFDGRSFSAYIAKPANTSAPAIIVCQEIFGVNVAMRQICDDLAAQGYIAICPDLFWRLQPNVELSDANEADVQQAYALYKDFNLEDGIVDLLATLRVARSLPECNGTAGTVGYCLGGLLSYLLLARSDLECGVSYYGVGIENHVNDAADIRRPLLMHLGTADELVPLAAQNILQTSLAKNTAINLQLYAAAGHAFARPQGMHYQAAAANLANQRTSDFLAAHLRR
jgi:carboxymethylenebutenolidase